MFDTAATGALIKSTERESADSYSAPLTDDCRVDFLQFLAIISVLWPNGNIEEAAMLFQESHEYEFPASKQRDQPPLGISFHSFIITAKRRKFFSKSQIYPFITDATVVSLNEDKG
eukprot:7984672-Ditylum_brightwellii.AAC.1